MSIPVRWNAIAACFLMTLCASPAAAVSVLEATLGFGGYSTPGRWAPLWIRCAEAPRSSSIQVARLGSDGKEISVETFPSLGGTRLECPVLLSEGLAALKVRLVAGSRTLAELDIDRNAGFFPGHLVLSCGLSASVRRAVSAALLPGEPIIVVPTALSALPANGLDYDGVSAIVVGATGVGGTAKDLLTTAQRNALLAWLAGGGSLVAEAEGGEPILESLGLDVGPGSEPLSFGFGRYSVLRTEGRSEETAWREALGLQPYGSLQMIGASAALRGADTKLVEPASAPWIRRIIAIALFTWLAAVVSAFFFARKKLAPVALVTGIALAVVLAGGGVLSRSIVRGARFRILVLALPEAETAFATFRAAAFEPKSPYAWLPSEVIGTISVDYAGEESGSFKEWNHLLGRSILSAAGSGRMTLSGLMTPDAWRRLDLPSMKTGSAEPPRIDSTRRLAYLGSGEGWWTKESGGAWLRAEEAPAWLEAEAAWLIDLKRMRKDAGLLVGTFPASLSGFSLQGAPPQGDIVWAMPLPVGDLR
jgi:hypothetical protein